MAIDNTSIGSVLTIPDGLISNLEAVDNRIKRIQESARATGATFNTQFAGMTANTNFLINNLDKIIGQLQSSGQIGASQIMAVKLAWDKLQEAMQYKNTGNIAMITDEIKGIDK